VIRKKKKKPDIREVRYWQGRREVEHIAKKSYIEGYGDPYLGYWYPIQAVVILEVILKKDNLLVYVDEWGNVWDERDGDPWIGVGSIFEFIEEQYGYQETTALQTVYIGAKLGQVSREELKSYDRRPYVDKGDLT
jgi:hypothetical protein